MLTNQTTAPISQLGPSAHVLTRDLIDFGGGDNRATASSAGTPASSSTGVAVPTSHQTIEGSGSPILPQVSVQFSDFHDVFDLFPPADDSGILANPIAVSTIQTLKLSDRPKPQNTFTETVISPTRTLFPSVPTTERVTAPEGNVIMTHAKTASLRHRNKELEEANEVLNTENAELRKKCENLEKKLAGLSALGVDL